MNNTSFWAAVIITTVCSFILGYTSASLMQKNEPVNQPILIEHHINKCDEHLSQADLYDMQHNTLIGRTNNSSLYLDNTADTDTLHIYIYN